MASGAPDDVAAQQGAERMESNGGEVAVEEQGQPSDMQLSEKEAQDLDVPSGDAPSFSTVDGGAAAYDPGRSLPAPGTTAGDEEEEEEEEEEENEQNGGGAIEGANGQSGQQGDGSSAVDPAQPQGVPAPQAAPVQAAAAKKPKAVGGFLVGDSDSEDDDNTPAAAPAPAENDEQEAEYDPGAAQPVTLPPAPAPAPAPAQPSFQPAPSAVPPQPTAATDPTSALEARIADDPRGSVDLWLTLINDHRQNGRFDEARSAFTRFLEVFPQAAEVWVDYIEMELELQNLAAAEALFGKSLTSVADVPLWVVYLDYVRRRNNLNDASGSEARTVVSRAYEFVLDNVGLDRDAGKIWEDYVQFIRSGPGTIGGSSWQDQQKMDQLRKAFRRATSVPISNVNQLWKEYDQFEMGLNKITGRKFLAERSPAYMSAKSANTALDNLTRGLSRTTIARLPPVAGFEGYQEYMTQLELWRKWIDWEKSDPLDLRDDEPEVLKARILYCYKRALMPMRFWPELWVEAAEWCFENDVKEAGKEKGLDFLLQGVAANPESILLALKHADRIEMTYPVEEGDAAKIARGLAVREPYDKIIKTLRDRHKLLQDNEKAEVARIEASFASSQNGPAADGYNDDDDDDNNDRGTQQQQSNPANDEKAQKIALIKQGFAAQMELVSKCLTHVWIALARAMRRIQGKGNPQGPLGGLRQVFFEARKGGRLKSDIYVAVAKMEWKCYNDKAGGKIFERGSKLFPEDPYFMIEYIKYLTAHGDNTNSRVVFETCVNKLAQKPETVHKAKPLLAYMHKREAEYGNLARVAELEKRMAELYPADPKLALFSKRFTTEKFDPVGARILISPAAQLRPRQILPSVEKQPPSLRGSPMLEAPGLRQGNSPRIPYLSGAGASTNTQSPKRPYADDLDDGRGHHNAPPRKIARGPEQREFQRAESPLKGAAGRRLDQQRRLHGGQGGGYGAASASGPPSLPTMVNFLLSQIPPAMQYNGIRYSAPALVHILRETDINPNAWEPTGRRSGGGAGKGSGRHHGRHGGGGGAAAHTRHVSSSDYAYHGGSRNSPAPVGGSGGRAASPYTYGGGGGGDGGRGAAYRQTSLRPDRPDDAYEPPRPGGGQYAGFDWAAAAAAAAAQGVPQQGYPVQQAPPPPQPFGGYRYP